MWGRAWRSSHYSRLIVDEDRQARELQMVQRSVMPVVVVMELLAIEQMVLYLRTLQRMGVAVEV